MIETVKKILLVEDSLMFGQLLKKRIEAELGFQVVWTKTLEETMNILEPEEDYFMVALLDYHLPDAPDGEIIAKVIAKGIPSIIFTGNTAPHVRDKVWSEKVVDYILKEDPNSLEYVLATIKRLIENIDSKVLVVDDSSFFRKSFSILLKIHQFQVFTAVNGEDALKVLKKHPDIKLILVDYNMPIMDGFALCKKVREQYKKGELSIIGTSASNDNDTPARFLKSGANDFIVKNSFLLEEFYCRINQSVDNVNMFKALREVAIKDFLTGLFNRRYFFEAGESIFVESKRNRTDLVCAMIDIDYFKKVNDTYGHDVGDLVIQQLSLILQNNMPETAIVARFGGEEFCILATSKEIPEIQKLFSELCKTVEQTPVLYNNGENNLHITISTGVCTDNCESLHQLVNKADQFLYMAKEQGRNKVIFSSEEK